MGKQATPRRLAETEAQAIGRMIRTSPRTLNLVAESIRGKKVQAAVEELTFSRKRIAKEVKKVLQSAIANAENNHDLDVDQLVVKEAWVGKNLIMKRMHPRGRGRSAPVEKPFSQLTIVVREVEKEAKKKAPKKAVRAPKKAPAAAAPAEGEA